MKINKEVISKLNPCKDRFDNFVKFYGDKEFTKSQFMGLKNISQFDKMWVAFRLMPKGSSVLCAADIAESVLHIFESKYPNDNRPRFAIEAARSGNVAGDDAYHAAYVAFYVASCVGASHDAAYAAYAAYYAAYDAAYAAADAACAASPGINQEKLNRKIILKYWR